MESKGTEDNCTFHPVTGRAARTSTVAFSRSATRARARALLCPSRLGGGGINKYKISLTVPFELLIVFLGPDRLNTLKYTQLSLTQRNIFYTSSMLDSVFWLPSCFFTKQLHFQPPSTCRSVQQRCEHRKGHVVQLFHTSFPYLKKTPKLSYNSETPEGQ